MNKSDLAVPGASYQSTDSLKYKLDAALKTLIERQPNDQRMRAKINVTILAREAKVDRSTIYRSYPEIAQQLRDLKPRVKKEKTQGREQEYRGLIEEAQRQVELLANITYRQQNQISLMEEQIATHEQVISELRMQLSSAAGSNAGQLHIVRKKM